MPLSPSLLRSLGEVVGAAGRPRRARGCDSVRVRRHGRAAPAARRASCSLTRPTRWSAASASRRSIACPIVTRGSGTGLSGGSVPTEDSLVLCLAQNERDPRSRCAQPDRAGAAGRHHAEDRRSRRRPWSLLSSRSGSMRISTIGGNVAENSGGLRGLKYGVTRDYVLGAGSRPARRTGRPSRQQVRQGRRRLLDEGPLHRLGRHARHHHRGAAEGAAEAGRASDDARALRSDRGRGRDRVGHHRRAHHSLHARVPRSR